MSYLLKQLEAPAPVTGQAVRQGRQSLRRQIPRFASNNRRTKQESPVQRHACQAPLQELDTTAIEPKNSSVFDGTALDYADVLKAKITEVLADQARRGQNEPAPSQAQRYAMMQDTLRFFDKGNEH